VAKDQGKSTKKFKTVPLSLYSGTEFVKAPSQSSRIIFDMKHIVLSLALLLFAGIAFAQPVTKPEHESKGNTNKDLGALIPDFKFYDMENKPVTRMNLVPDVPTIFFYFDPDCDHCQYIATMITTHKELFKGITLVLISWAEVEQIKAFPGKYLPGFPGTLLVTKDSEYKIDKWFGYSQTPSIYVYNKVYKRTASFEDEVGPEILVKFARQQ
jgi:peroxiredoxin